MLGGVEVEYFCRYACLAGKDGNPPNVDVFTGCQDSSQIDREAVGMWECQCDHEDYCNQVECSLEELKTMGPKSVVYTAPSPKEFLPVK